MKVTYKEKSFEIEKSTRVIDILKDDCTEEIIACICNNQIKPLDFLITEDTKIELIDISHEDGMRIYIRGLVYIMAKVFYELYPKALVTVDYQLSNSMFCELDNMEITQEMITKVKKRMQEIIDQNMEIRKVILTKEEAKEFYKKIKR